MKKILLIVASFVWFIPITLAAEECSNETVSELKNQIKNIDFTYEYMQDGSKIDLQNDIGEIFQADVSNKIKVTLNNLPDNYMISLYDGNTYYNLINNIPEYMTGGVYTVKVYFGDCEQVITNYEIMIPYCNTKNENIWDDGTYNSKNNKNNSSNSFKLNFILLLIVIFLITGLVILFIFLNRKRVEKNGKVN